MYSVQCTGCQCPLASVQLHPVLYSLYTPAPALSLNWLRGEQLLTTTQCLDLVIFTHLHLACNKQLKLVRKHHSALSKECLDLKEVKTGHYYGEGSCLGQPRQQHPRRIFSHINLDFFICNKRLPWQSQQAPGCRILLLGKELWEVMK